MRFIGFAIGLLFFVLCAPIVVAQPFDSQRFVASVPHDIVRLGEDVLPSEAIDYVREIHGRHVGEDTFDRRVSVEAPIVRIEDGEFGDGERDYLLGGGCLSARYAPINVGRLTAAEFIDHRAVTEQWRLLLHYQREAARFAEVYSRNLAERLAKRVDEVCGDRSRLEPDEIVSAVVDHKALVCRFEDRLKEYYNELREKDPFGIDADYRPPPSRIFEDACLIEQYRLKTLDEHFKLCVFPSKREIRIRERKPRESPFADGFPTPIAFEFTPSESDCVQSRARRGTDDAIKITIVVLNTLRLARQIDAAAEASDRAEIKLKLVRLGDFLWDSYRQKLRSVTFVARVLDEQATK